MRTADALKIGIALGRLMNTVDAWEESKHKRDADGKFSSTGGGGSKNTKEKTKEKSSKSKSTRTKEERMQKVKKVIASLREYNIERNAIPEEEMEKILKSTEKDYEASIKYDQLPFVSLSEIQHWIEDPEKYGFKK